MRMHARRRDEPPHVVVTSQMPHVGGGGGGGGTDQLPLLTKLKKGKARKKPSSDSPAPAEDGRMGSVALEGSSHFTSHCAIWLVFHSGEKIRRDPGWLFIHSCSILSHSSIIQYISVGIDSYTSASVRLFWRLRRRYWQQRPEASPSSASPYCGSPVPLTAPTGVWTSSTFITHSLLLISSAISPSIRPSHTRTSASHRFHSPIGRKRPPSSSRHL